MSVRADSNLNNDSVDLELAGIYKSFGHTVAVDDLYLEVKKGEFLFLLGPSGCGKTTTLRMIAGFIHPESGKILIRGKDVSRVPAHRRGLGMVFQDYALFPHMTVFDNVAFGLRMQKVQKKKWRERVGRALELVQLEGLEERYPRQLSGGQQQRVALSRALVIEPAVLLLDEPLSNLDLKLRQQMRVELRQLQERVGITTIFVTHDQEEALSMGDRIAVMESGRINQLGKPKEIYQYPKSRFIADFIGESNFFHGKVKTIESTDEARIITHNGVSLIGKARDPFQPGQSVNAVVRPEKISLFHQPPAEYPNRMPGKVLTAVFTGSYTRFQILTQGEDLCVVQQQNTRDSQTFDKGDPVHLAWTVEDTLIIPER